MRKIVKLLLFVGAFIVLAQVSLKPASAQEYHAELATEEKQGDNILVTICVSSTSPENLLAIDHIVLTCRAAEYSKDLPGFPTLVDKCHDDSLDKVLGEAKTWQDPVTVTTNIIASVPAIFSTEYWKVIDLFEGIKTEHEALLLRTPLSLLESN